MVKKVVIIGGVAGGASAAARLRRLDEEIEIVMFEKGDYISFANCGLPYHIGGIIPERKQLLVQTVDGMQGRFNIDIRINSEVIKIDREKKEVEVKDYLKRKVYTESYDILLLSPGAAPLRPPIKGVDLPNILTLRNMADMDAIIKKIKDKGLGHCAIVGGGFIGVEMAENLKYLGWQVSLIERQEQVMPNLDREMAAFVHQEMRKNGIELILEDSVIAFEEGTDNTQVLLNSGRMVETNLVILAVGVKADSKLASEAGLEIGSTGGIKVNESFQTSDPSIMAVGDAIEVSDFITGKSTWVPLANPANRQGRLAADIISGKNVRYDGIQATAIAKVFDLVCASTGKNERALEKDGIEYLTSISHSNSHAGYYPGAFPLTIKILYTKNGKLLGAQIVGYKGVDKRIDVLATALRFGANVEELAKLELAYAPPFSSAKDPVNIAGYVASNIISGDMEIVYWHEVSKLISENAFIIDVREPIERDSGFIEGSVNISLNQMRNRLQEIPYNRKIIVYCQVGLRAYIGARILMQHGFADVYNLSGGYKIYKTITEDYDQISTKGKKEIQKGAEEVAATDKFLKDGQCFKADCSC